MQQTHNRSTALAAVVLIVGSLLVWPTASRAQTVTGQARAVQATVLGQTTVLADTGTLAGPSDARDASQLTGSVPSVLTGEVLHAVTIGGPDQVDSEASLAGLGLTVGATTVSADFVIARASAALGAAASGSSDISNLTINGLPIVVTGQANQTISIPGGQVVINEQTITPSGTAVTNALHVTVNGVADVVIATATAGIS